MAAELIVPDFLKPEVKEYAQDLANTLPKGFLVLVEETEDRDEHWITVRCEYVIKSKLDLTTRPIEAYNNVVNNFDAGMSYMLEKLGRARS